MDDQGTAISDRDVRDLMMEFGWAGLDATAKIAEVKAAGHGEIELADEGAPAPYVIAGYDDGQWTTRH